MTYEDAILYVHNFTAISVNYLYDNGNLKQKNDKHVFIMCEAVEKTKELLDSGELKNLDKEYKHND